MVLDYNYTGTTTTPLLDNIFQFCLKVNSLQGHGYRQCGNTYHSQFRTKEEFSLFRLVRGVVAHRIQASHDRETIGCLELQSQSTTTILYQVFNLIISSRVPYITNV